MEKIIKLFRGLTPRWSGSFARSFEFLRGVYPEHVLNPSYLRINSVKGRPEDVSKGSEQAWDTARFTIDGVGARDRNQKSW